MKFGTWIRAHRLRLGLSMDQVCRNVELSKAYLSLIENGQKGPPKDEIVRQIGRALGLDEGDLLMRSHRERYPEDVQELRLLIREMRDALDAIRGRAGSGESSDGNGQSTEMSKDKASAALVQSLRALERLVPPDSSNGSALLGELDDLRAEERDFVLSMIREMKQLRPRRGPQSPERPAARSGRGA